MRPDDKRLGYHGKIPEADVRAAHRIYESAGLTCNEIGAQIWERYGYTGPRQCGNALHRAFQRLGLPTRTVSEATIRRNFKHGRKARDISSEDDVAYRHWLAEQRGWKSVQGPGQERCEGIRRQPPGKGKQCDRPAKTGSRFCPSHDPARELERELHLARIRELRPKREMVPLYPFARWLRLRKREVGRAALAERLGCSKARLYDLIAGRDGAGSTKTEIGRDTIERYLDRDGTTSFDELYGGDPLYAKPEAIAA